MKLLIIPPMTGVARGRITSEPVLVLHMIGSNPTTVVATVMTFGRSRRRAPSFTAWIRCRWLNAAPCSACAFLERFLEVDHHHDAGLDGRAEQRNVADPHRDAEIVAQQELQVDAAGQRERHGRMTWAASLADR